MFRLMEDGRVTITRTIHVDDLCAVGNKKN